MLPRFTLSERDFPAVSLFLRMTLGLILLFRDSHMWYAYNKLPEFASPAWNGFLHPGLIVVLAVFLILGFMTRASFLVLAIVYISYSTSMRAMNLGPLFLPPLFILGFLIPVISPYSLDKFLSPKLRLNRDFIPPAYMGHFLMWLFFLYAINSFCAVIFHMQDSSWLSGTTVWKLLINNFLNRAFASFRAFEEAFGAGWLYWFSLISVILQTIYQIFMWPLIYNKWGRLFVIIHGYIFFLISLVFLQISILPFVEIILWTVIFWNDLKILLRIDRIKDFQILPKNIRLEKALTFLIFLLSAVTVTNSITIVNPDFPSLYNTRVPVHMIKIGLWPPNVFNKNDLEMGQTWYRLYFLDSTTQEKIRIPVFHEDGGRDDYHYFDYVYYGMTLPWRRATIGFDQWEDPEKMSYFMEGIKWVAKFHMRLEKVSQPREFFYEIVSDHSMDVSLPTTQRYQTKVIQSGTFTLDPIVNAAK